MAASDASGNEQVSAKQPLGKDTLWLVKSGDRVLGPFTTGDVIRRLRSKELVVIDEIISPQSRWRHIRDEGLFASVVDEIRTGLMTVRDDTEVDDNIETRRINLSDLTPDPTSVGAATSARFDSSINVSRISDADIVSETNDVEPIHHASAREIERPTTKKTRKSGSSKGHKKSGVHSTLAYDPKGKHGRDAIVSKTSKALWGLILAGVIAASGSVYLFKILPARRATARAEEVGRLREEADRAWARAEFQRARKLYEQINREPHVDLETDLRQAILQLRVERETLAAKRRLEELIPKLSTSEGKTRARMALAVADLQADNVKEALTAFRNLVREPEAGPIAFFNLGCAQAASGARGDAIETLKKLESHPTLGAPSRLLRAILFMQNSKDGKDGSAKQASLATGLDEKGGQPAWSQELLTLGAAADWIDGNKKRSNQRLRLALDTDAFQTEEFFFDPLLYLEAVRWKELLPFVKDFSARSKSNSAKALYALALIKSDRRAEAQKFLAESLSSKVSDGDLQAVSAYGLMMQGRDDEARGALKFARVGSSESVPMVSAILDARIYERAGDRNAADTVWTEISKRPNPPLAALVSVARIDSQIATEKMIGAVERLKTLYPNFIPVIRLHDDVFSNAEKPAKGSTP